MRAVIQRCACCEVLSEGQLVGSVGQGLVIFLGIKKGDTIKDGIYIADKIMNLRIFEDEEGKLNKSILNVDGELMIVSQFTLYGDCRHGRRPSFFDAEEPLKANKLYEDVVTYCREKGISVKTGKFQTMMNVKLDNIGPVTILLDSEKVF